MQATLAVAGSAVVPLLFWLSAAAGSLVLLRRGFGDAFGVLAWAVLPAMFWWYLGDPSILLVLLGTLTLAQILRAVRPGAMCCWAVLQLAWYSRWCWGIPPAS